MRRSSRLRAGAQHAQRARGARGSWSIVGEPDPLFCANAGYAAATGCSTHDLTTSVYLPPNSIIPDLSDQQNHQLARMKPPSIGCSIRCCARSAAPTRRIGRAGVLSRRVAEQMTRGAGHAAAWSVRLSKRMIPSASAGARSARTLSHLAWSLPPRVGHYFWDRLVRDRHVEGEFAATFGNFSADYSQALQTYYANGAPADWQNNFVSAYATAHPWEDFAETWAHYLHLVDTTEMAASFDLHLDPRIDRTGGLEANVNFNPYRARNFQNVIDNWLPMSFAMNNINRCMGQPDLYPFVLSARAIEKLAFVHGLIHRDVTVEAAKAPPAPLPAAR